MFPFGDPSRNQDRNPFPTREDIFRPSNSITPQTSSRESLRSVPTGPIVFGSTTGECQVESYCKFCEDDGIFRYSLSDVKKKLSQSQLSIGVSNHPPSLFTGRMERNQVGTLAAEDPMSLTPNFNSPFSDPNFNRDRYGIEMPAHSRNLPTTVVLRCKCTECQYPSDVQVPVPEHIINEVSSLTSSVSPRSFHEQPNTSSTAPTLPSGNISSSQNRQEHVSTPNAEGSGAEGSSSDSSRHTLSEETRNIFLQQQERRRQEDQARARANAASMNTNSNVGPSRIALGQAGNGTTHSEADLSHLAPWFAHIILSSLIQDQGDYSEQQNEDEQDEETLFHFPRSVEQEGRNGSRWNLAEMERAQQGSSFEDIVERVTAEQIKKPTEKKFLASLMTKIRKVRDRDVNLLCLAIAGISKEFHVCPAQFGPNVFRLQSLTSKSTSSTGPKTILSNHENLVLIGQGPLGIPSTTIHAVLEDPSLEPKLNMAGMSGKTLDGIDGGPDNISFVALSRGEISFADKCLKAQSKGYEIVLVFQTDAKAPWPYLMTDTATNGKGVTAPCVMTSYKDSQNILQSLIHTIRSTGTATATAGANPSNNNIAFPEACLYVRHKPIECAICMTGCEVDDDIIPLGCKHIFHPDCIEPWLKEQHTCPTCRYEMPSEKPVVTNNRNESLEQMKSDMFT